MSIWIGEILQEQGKIIINTNAILKYGADKHSLRLCLDNYFNNPKEPETVSSHEAEKVVCEHDFYAVSETAMECIYCKKIKW